MGPFSAPRKIADRSKIARLRDNSDFDPRKMPSVRGFEKNMKIRWKNDAKMRGFWWLRTTFGVILFAYNTLSPFSEKVEKSIPKGSPKVEVFAPKTDLGNPRVDWFCHFGRFWRIRKIIVFSMSLWIVEKSIKIEPWGVQGAKTAFRVGSSRAFLGSVAPGRRPLSKIFEEYKHKDWEADPNTPWAIGPANFCNRF